MTSPSETRRPPPPPVSMTSLPSGAAAKTPASRRAVCAPPVLASDILREEVAPIAPARRALRASLASFAVVTAVGAVAAYVGLGPLVLAPPHAFEGAVAAAAIAAIAAIAPVSYGLRALLAVVPAALVLGMGVARVGPMAAFGDDGAWRALAALPLIVLLPAALVFRARYRAFGGARVALAIALVASVPALALLGASALGGGTSDIDRVGAAIAAGSALTALFGFMGPETSGGCAQWAGLIVAAHALRPTLRALEAAWRGDAAALTAQGATALGELVSATLLALALFQLLAVAFRGAARKVDVHRIVGAGAEDAPSDRDGAADGRDARDEADGRADRDAAASGR